MTFHSYTIYIYTLGQGFSCYDTINNSAKYKAAGGKTTIKAWLISAYGLAHFMKMTNLYIGIASILLFGMFKTAVYYYYEDKNVWYRKLTAETSKWKCFAGCTIVYLAFGERKSGILDKSGTISWPKLCYTNCLFLKCLAVKYIEIYMPWLERF